MNLQVQPTLKPFMALKECFKEGYQLKTFKADVLAGLVVALVALPLAMALAIGTGIAPQYGIYTAIFAGFFTALLGGSRYQITGPTAAFVVILVPIVEKFGFSGLLLATLFAGIILIIMGITRMGRFIQYVPYPVITGFTTGIAVVIAVLQIKDFFGLTIIQTPHNFIERISGIVQALFTFQWTEAFIGVATLLLIIFWLRSPFSRRFPAPLFAIGTITFLVVLGQHFDPRLAVRTIGTEFGGIPHKLPELAFPWSFVGPDGVRFELSFDLFREMIPSAFVIAFLGAIESLLSAVVADGMTGRHHDPDAELLALGTANLITPFFGGFAATGAIARTATNIRFGGQTPIAGMSHAVFILLILAVFTPALSYLPLSALAALLLFLSYNMADFSHFKRLLKSAPLGDRAVLLTCFLFTVFFDMVVGVAVGFSIAALLFMKKMADNTRAELINSTRTDIPPEILVYNIAGPLFFGAARKAMATIQANRIQTRQVIFILNQVSSIDLSGLVAFKEVLDRLGEQDIKIYISGLKNEVYEICKQNKIFENQVVHMTLGLEEALTLAKKSNNKE